MSEQKKTTPTTKTPTKQMRVRARISVLVVVGLFFMVTVLRLGYLQIFQAEDWQRQAVSQQLSDTIVSAKRGTIYASDMTPLAESADVWKIIMSPKNIAACDWQELEGVDKNRNLSQEEGLELVRRRIAEELAEMFQLDEEALYKKTGKISSQYEVIKAKVEYKEKTAFTEWANANGLNPAFYIVTDYKRYYPQGSMASTVLGFTGTDNNGLEGLEAMYDSLLTGTPGRIVTAQNGIGDQMPTTMEYTKVVDAVDGYGLVTTIDPVVQAATERFLSEAVEETGTRERGVAIVMDVNTGAILAMSTKEDYNPNTPHSIPEQKTESIKNQLAGVPDEAEEPTDEDEEPAEEPEEKEESPADRWKNKAITDPYEPGSVFKVFTTAMALEEGLANENTSFKCEGSISVGGHNISCHTRNHMGILNLHDAISKSCNPYFVQLGLKIGPSVYYKYFSGFGFTERTGIDMNGESSNEGLYHNYDKLTETVSSLATGAFGQTFKVTPIQMITAMSAVANGGKLLTPYVVSKVLDGDGNVVSETQPKVKRQIISEDTSNRICSILGDIVNGGGSKNAYVPGYRIAGKTGTSEKRDTADEDDVVASFCGFAPADNPQVAVLVLLDDPQTEVRYGGTLSAPVAQKIFEAILPHLGVEPSYTNEELSSLSRTTPNVVKDAVDVAKNKITNAGLKVKVEGNGDKVVRQVPESGQSVPAGGTVILYTEEDEVTMVTVPDLTGRSVTEVNSIAASLGLNVQMQGLVGGSSAAAISSKQSVKADTQVPKGTVITVSFVYNDTRDG